jgi:hypothetical protein
MSAAERRLEELASALRVRGRARRRLLAECRDHLTDATAAHGDEEAARRFGDVQDLAAALDTEVAVRRSIRATAATAIGVLAVGGSTLAMLNASVVGASLPAAWVVVFFGCAQASATCAGLAVLRAAAMAREESGAGDVAGLCRRNLLALALAALTMFAAGAAVPGRAAAWIVLLGPALASTAIIAVLRARSLARRIDPRAGVDRRSPVTDLATVAARLLPRGEVAVPPIRFVLVPTALLAAAAAFAWDHGDHGTVTTSLAAAGVEALLTIGGFVVLGPALGLRTRSARFRRRTTA